MGIRDAVLITVILTQSLSCVQSLSLAGSLLQGLLSSNPQLLKMASNRLIQQAAEYQPCYENVAQVLSGGQCLGPYQSAVKYKTPVAVASAPVATTPLVAGPVASVASASVAATPTAPVVSYPQPNLQYSSVQQTYQTPPNPCPFSSPAAMVNPFLPAASPVSALCPPTSNLLPPANPALARSQFLRKIPIPPPCM